MLMWNNLPRWRHENVREKTTIRTFVVQISKLPSQIDRFRMVNNIVEITVDQQLILKKIGVICGLNLGTCRWLHCFVIFSTALARMLAFLSEDSPSVEQVGVHESPVTSHFSPITLVATCHAVFLAAIHLRRTFKRSPNRFRSIRRVNERCDEHDRQSPLHGLQPQWCCRLHTIFPTAP
jgi:hypothetical protein